MSGFRDHRIRAEVLHELKDLIKGHLAWNSGSAVRITEHAADGPFVTPLVPSAAPTLRDRFRS